MAKLPDSQPGALDAQRTRLNPMKLLWPYAKREINVVLPPDEAIERVRSFIVYESWIWAELHYREAKGQFWGKVSGLRFRMARVVRHRFMPYILGRVMRGASGNTVVRLRFTIGAAYVLPLFSIGFATYLVSTAQFGPAVFFVAFLAWFCFNVTDFWREVDITVEQLRAALQPQAPIRHLRLE